MPCRRKEMGGNGREGKNLEKIEIVVHDTPDVETSKQVRRK
jgi:hypothetical protein